MLHLYGDGREVVLTPCTAIALRHCSFGPFEQMTFFN